MSVDFGWAVKQPFSNMKKLGIGTILGAIPIVSMLTVMGYALNSAKSAVGKKALPEWNNWGDIIVKSLLGLVITLIYMIPALIVGAVLIGSAFIAIMTAISTGGNMAGFSFGNFMGGLMIFFLLVLVTAFFLPAALTMYALKNKFGEAFNFGAIFKRAFTGDYIVAWIVAGVYSFVLMIIASMVSLAVGMVPAIGFLLAWIVTGFAAFVSYVTCYSIFGQLKY